ncbi:MAG: nitrile hydratase subunit alpha [Nitriliruptoraceae bacterium]
MGEGHEHPPGHMHLQDPAANLEAIIADLEYFRRKRLESRVLFFARRRILSLPDLLRAARDLPDTPPEVPPAALDDRIKRLQERLDAICTGILSLQVPLRDTTLAIDDTRRERGDYDEFFRLAYRQFPPDLMARIEAVEAAMADDELVIAAARHGLVRTGQTSEQAFEDRLEQLRSLGWRNGARIVARAWVDDDFRQRLLSTGREAVRELDIPPGKLGLLGVAENTDEVHNVVVCTLCSCYPHDLLGNPPWWYRTDDYKERIIRDPRGMLAEAFDLHLPDGVEVRVHDSTSDVRWMVLPQRPAGTDGLDEDELAELVTLESMVGTARAGETPAATDTVVSGLEAGR